ncbi:MAG: hypothetical protein IT340_07000 [Chloroflexi bacterium]|nr:hypothetical protein [Chloroflexota bacterium]
MPESPRPHTSPPELAKDVLTKLDNARAAVSRARAVAQRAGFTTTEALLVDLEREVERVAADTETALRVDVRRALAGAATPPA